MDFQAPSEAAEMHKPLMSSRARAPGYSLIEMLVVIAIIAILASMTFGVFMRMQKNQRLSNSAARVYSTLAMARNLSINNNAIYQIQIHNWDKTVTPAGSDEKCAESQFISVHCYPKVSDALYVRDNPLAPYDKASAYAWNNSATASVNPNIPVVPPASGTLYSNYQVDAYFLEKFCYLGVQEPAYAAATYTSPGDTVITFYPDGQASGRFALYVTDALDFKEDRSANAQITGQARLSAFDQRAGAKDTDRVRMIDIFQGGLVKPRIKQVAQ